MIAFAADLHLRRFMWRSRRDMDGDGFRALASMREALLQRWGSSPDKELHVILGGDIFDEKRVDGATLQAFTDFIDQLYTAGVDVYFVQGNHDYDAIEPLAAVQGATHIHEKTVRLDGKTVYGLDWQCKSDLAGALSSVPACDVLVLHQMFEHLVNFEAAADLSLDDVPLQAQNVLVGDVHIRNITQLRGTGVCISPGPIQPCNIEQAGPHGAYILEEGKTEWEFVPHQSRDIIRLSVQDEESVTIVSDVLDKLAAGPPSPPYLEPIVEVRYLSQLSEDVEQILQNADTVKVFARPISSGLVTGDHLQQAREDVGDLSLQASLPVFCDPTKKPTLYTFLASCLAGNEDLEIQRLLDKGVVDEICIPNPN
jgi:predicted phosphodiesterase